MRRALMMRSIWRDDVSSFVVASVLRRLSPRGEVSHEEALAQAHEAIRADLESRRVFGDPIPEPTPRFLPEQTIG
jgi:hypothetical protein